MSDSEPEQHVLYEVVGGLGVITLNRPQALNALSLEMVRTLTRVLQAWRSDPSVAGVLLRGAPKPLAGGQPGATHFCAGGDIRFMHAAALRADPAIDDFFTEEYALNHLIHTYPKPTVAWVEGVCMGGGMGLAQGCAFRVGTATLRMAMPETRIGLFPDVAGGYFLSRCAGAVGEYLGVVGTHVQVSDALLLGWAHGHARADTLPTLLSAFAAQPAQCLQDVYQHLHDHLRGHGLTALPEAPITVSMAQINRHFSLPTLGEITASLAADASPWAKETLAHMAGNSPLMMAVTLAQIRRARGMALADELRMERSMVRHCFTLRPGAASETVEGVRALVIDKDMQPRWQPASVAELTPAMVDAFFEDAWPEADHPLKHLLD